MYQIIILGFIFLYILKRSRDLRNTNLNLPPLVSYKIPIIGHTLSYMFDTEKFLKQCRQEYGDIFSLYLWGQTITFVGKEHINEVLSRDDSFDFNEAINQRIPNDIFFNHTGGFKDSKYNAKVTKELISNKLGLYTERMQKSLHFAVQKYIGDFEGQKVFYKFSNLMKKIISIPVANVFIGEDESEYDDIITTFSEFTSDVGVFFMMPPILDFIYPGLQDFVNRIPLRLGLFNPVTKHEVVLIRHIKHLVDKRLREKQKYGDLWKRPNDLLQDFMEEESFDPNNVNYVKLANKLLVFIFASVHTTSKNGTNAIINLASRPEYMQELYEEQFEVHKKVDKNGILPFEALEEMKKLDSFVRESFRLADNISGLAHLVLKDYTFSNGLQVPKGHLVDLYADDVARDESLQGPNPKSFEPFRHLNTNVTASKIGKGYMIFGGGKHACPGRFFAVNEIKFLMHHIILNYNIRMESGKIEERSRFGPISIPSSSGIIFEKRN